MARPDWDEYFLEIASVVAKRSTCNRKQVGCVLVRDKQIIATGYGGSIRGQPHCTDVGCKIDEKTGGCVAGDTVVSKMQTGRDNTGHRTAEKIVDQWGHPRKKGAMKRMQIRSAAPNDAIVPGRIEDAWCSGDKATITVTTRLGRSVTLTPDHLMKVPGGWKPAGDLIVGVDCVGLNGQPVYRSEVWLRKAYGKPGATFTSIARLANCSEKSIRRLVDYFRIPRKTLSETRWNTGLRMSPAGKVYAHPCSYRGAARRYALLDVCEVCGATDDLQVHHVDGDYTNNLRTNLMTLCVPCHCIADTPHAKVEAVRYDIVTDVQPSGIRPVFDLTVAPHANFVGNGFILHNCVRTVHAEMNAVAQAARNGVSTENTTAYLTLSPCEWCFRTLANAGVTRIVYAEEYRIPPDFELAASCGIAMELGQLPDHVVDESASLAALKRVRELAADREAYVAQGPFVLSKIQRIVEEALNSVHDLSSKSEVP